MSRLMHARTGTGSHGSSSHGSGSHGTSGVVLEWGWMGDLEVWFFDRFVMGGQVGRLRNRVVELAQLDPGRSVLDVGCGTGSLAVEAAGTVGPSGRVAGVDPGSRQIARAGAKARRAGRAVDFRIGVIEALPFEDASFDTVTSTWMMHHLPGDLKARGLAEIRRVLRPGGRVVIADFDSPEDRSSAERPDRVDLALLLTATGFVDPETERVRFKKPHHGWDGATLMWATRPG